MFCYGTKGDCVTLGALSKREQFNSHSNNYLNWKEKLIKLNGRDGASMVTIGADDTPGFHLTWTENPTEITGFNFDYLTIDEREVIQLLDEFMVRRSCTKIIMNRGKDKEIDNYLHKFEIIVTPSLLGLFTCLITYVLIFSIWVRKCHPSL